MRPGLPRRPERYTVVARWYDRLSGEPVYRRGRRLAVPLLALRPGDTVLDLGCGTGLNFPLLGRAVGGAGRVVGVDASAQMLGQARRRQGRLEGPQGSQRRAGPDVVLVHADATALEPDELLAAAGGPVDAVVATYALSLMTDWRRAFELALSVTRPGGRIAVVDMRRPTHALRPLASVAMAMGGADPGAWPWRAVEEQCTDVAAPTSAGAHIQVRVGTRRPG